MGLISIIGNYDSLVIRDTIPELFGKARAQLSTI